MHSSPACAHSEMTACLGRHVRNPDGGCLRRPTVGHRCSDRNAARASQLEVSRNPHAARDGVRVSGLSPAYANAVNARTVRQNLGNNS